MYLYYYIIGTCFTTTTDYNLYPSRIICTHHVGSPRNVSLTAHSSRSLTMTWNLPMDLKEKHGSILSYKIKCWQGEQPTVTYSLGNVTQFIIGDCLPYKAYKCCVSLHTTLANSTEVCRQQRTLQAGIYVLRSYK